MPNPQTALYELFLACFSPDELRMFVRTLPNGSMIANSLPGASVNASLLAYEASDVLRRHGALNSVFFSELSMARPLEAERIHDVARMHGVVIAETPATSTMSGFLRPPEVIDRTQAKILLLTSNPTSTPLGLDREVRNIRNAIEASTHRSHFAIETRQAVRVDDLVPLFLKNEPNIVHFSGFGAGSSGLVFANNRDEVALVKPDALRRLFSIVNGDARGGVGREIHVVVLNACLSAPQAEAIVMEVDCVIGMNHLVPDAAAIGFATTFYAAITEGRSVATAFELARVGSDLEGLGVDGLPRLFERTPGIARKTTFGR